MSSLTAYPSRTRTASGTGNAERQSSTFHTMISLPLWNAGGEESVPHFPRPPGPDGKSHETRRVQRSDICCSLPVLNSCRRRGNRRIHSCKGTGNQVTGKGKGFLADTLSGRALYWFFPIRPSQEHFSAVSSVPFSRVSQMASLVYRHFSCASCSSSRPGQTYFSDPYSGRRRSDGRGSGYAAPPQAAPTAGTHRRQFPPVKPFLCFSIGTVCFSCAVLLWLTVDFQEGMELTFLW